MSGQDRYVENFLDEYGAELQNQNVEQIRSFSFPPNQRESQKEEMNINDTQNTNSTIQFNQKKMKSLSVSKKGNLIKNSKHFSNKIKTKKINGPPNQIMTESFNEKINSYSDSDSDSNSNSDSELDSESDLESELKSELEQIEKESSQQQNLIEQTDSMDIDQTESKSQISSDELQQFLSQKPAPKIGFRLDKIAAYNPSIIQGWSPNSYHLYIKKRIVPEYVELRDDVIELLVSLTGKQTRTQSAKLSHKNKQVKTDDWRNTRRGLTAFFTNTLGLTNQTNRQQGRMIFRRQI